MADRCPSSCIHPVVKGSGASIMNRSKTAAEAVSSITLHHSVERLAKPAWRPRWTAR